MTVEQLISILEAQPREAQVFCLDIENGCLLFDEKPVSDVVVAVVHESGQDDIVLESVPKIVIRYRF